MPQAVPMFLVTGMALIGAITGPFPRHGNYHEELGLFFVTAIAGAAVLAAAGLGA